MFKTTELKKSGRKCRMLAACTAFFLMCGAIGGCAELLSVPRHVNKLAKEKSVEIAEKWYADQKEKDVYVLPEKTEAIYGSIFKGKSDIEAECVDTKCWNGTPDIDELNAMLDAELTEVSKFGISIVLTNEKVTKVTCKRQVVFGPYLSVGILTAYLFGDLIIAWYLGIAGIV